MKYEQSIIDQAFKMIADQIKEPGEILNSPNQVKAMAVLKLGHRRLEHFVVFYFNNQHQLLEYVEHFHGTINASKVHPRAVVQKALDLNAAAVVFAHNHPSGIELPSQSDLEITKILKDILYVVDVRTLDHIIVAGDKTYSMTEHDQIN